MVAAVPVLGCVQEGDRSTGRGRREVHAQALIERDGEDLAPGGVLRLVGLQVVLDPRRDVEYGGLVGVELSRDSHRAPEVARAALAHLTAAERETA